MDILKNKKGMTGKEMNMLVAFVVVIIVAFFLGKLF